MNSPAGTAWGLMLTVILTWASCASDPAKLALYYHDRADMAQFAGQLDEAEAYYAKSLAIEPDRAIAWNSRGVCLRKMGRYDEAEAAHRKALELQPGTESFEADLQRTLRESAKAH